MPITRVVPPMEAFLAIENEFTHHCIEKEARIRSEMNLGTVRYYQLLDRILESPIALAADPLLVRRLRRMRSSSRFRLRSA